MRIVVCLRQGLDGEISPFDASAYEAALRMEGAEVILLSMAAPPSRDFLLRLSRLGARQAVLLSDPAFAGADTLATAYTLSLAIKRLSPDLVLCGRQTLIGDTAQTGPMLAELASLSLATGVMHIDGEEDGCIRCTTRSEGEMRVPLPALLTVERIHTLRLPSLRSSVGELSVWDAAALGADVARCGLGGSPTRVLRTYENTSGKRTCRRITMEELPRVVSESLAKRREMPSAPRGGEQLSHICTVGEATVPFAKTVCDRVTVIPLTDADGIIENIRALAPDAVLWGSDASSKRLAAVVAARLGLGLCADLTAIGCEDGELVMYRPALSGSIIAAIKSNTRPAMATVRTESGDRADVIVTAGYGVKDNMDAVRELADSLGAELCATRRLVDSGYTPYGMQVGLTGKTVSPPVYIAVGVSGAVHHVVGMERSGTVIAINPDQNAPIFEYADYGIVACIG